MTNQQEFDCGISWYIQHDTADSLKTSLHSNGLPRWENELRPHVYITTHLPNIYLTNNI